ncbi:MAG: hypothetical protein D6732_00510, partial [Methanobacteriota archaeon]
MAIRVPRGYEVNRPPYQEISKGERLAPTAVPMKAHTGLAPVRIDEQHNDPIVLDPGTIVGPSADTDANGLPYLIPAMWATGASGKLTVRNHSDGATWGLPATGTTDITITNKKVKPIGVVYQPIYSFYLQEHFTNYKRNESMGVLTDYVIQVPAVTANEQTIAAGDMVMVQHVDTVAYQGKLIDTDYTSNLVAGRYEAYDPSITGSDEFVVGRCLSSVHFATGGTSVAEGDTLKSKISDVTLTDAGKALFADLA